jgi:hypothetical protein
MGPEAARSGPAERSAARPSIFYSFFYSTGWDSVV